MSSPIEHSILIRADATRIYRALVDRDNIATWWGQLADTDTENDGRWADGDHGNPITIMSEKQDSTLTLSMSEQDGGASDTIVTFDIEPHSGYCVVRVTRTGSREDRSAERINDGWPTTLIRLQAWVERGRSAAELNNPALFDTIRREMTVPANRAVSWNAITDATTMGTWLAAKVACEPALGGSIDILWPDGSHVGGETVLSSPPSDWIVHWWDADSLATNNDPGMITTQHWHVTDAGDGGSTIRLVETGYDRATVDDTYLASIKEGWDDFFTNLSALLDPQEGDIT